MGGYLQGNLLNQNSSPIPSQLSGLPRDPREFVTGSFGPLTPIEPIGVDVPDPESGRAEPRRWQYPVGWNLPVGVPGTEGLKLTSFQNLRALADAYSVARACITLRQNEILGMEWDIGPTDEAEKRMHGDHEAYREFNERRAKLISFWRRPDPSYNDFHGFFRTVLEDMFVCDAVSLYLHPSRRPGKGVCGSDLAALDVLDGTTVRPLLDLRGGTPAPPNPAYQQYLWGVPRVDLMDIIMETDVEGMSAAKVREYRGDQLLYLRYYPRDWTPYGLSPIEQAIIPVMAGLAKQQYTLSYFDEGSIPGMFLTAGPDFSSPSQIATLQHALNSIAGDIGFKHKIIVLPPGCVPTPIKPVSLADDFDQLVMEWVLMAFDVQPFELGIIITRSAGAASVATPTSITGAAVDAQNEAARRKSLRPLLKFLKYTIFDFIIREVCGMDDMEWKWKGLEEDPMRTNPEGKARQYATLVASGILSVDEVREEIGRNPWGQTDTSEPVYYTPSSPVPIVWQASDTPVTANSGPSPADEAHEQALTELEEEEARDRKQRYGASGEQEGTVGEEGTRARETGPDGLLSNRKHPTPAHSSATPPSKDDRPTPKSLSVAWSPSAHRAMMTEFQKLQRITKKGRPLGSFKPQDIPLPIWEAMLEHEDTSDALTHGLHLASDWAHASRRDSAIELQMSSLTVPLGATFRKFLRHRLSESQFVAQAVKSISAALTGVVAVAADDAMPENLPASAHGGWEAIKTEIVTRRTAETESFLPSWLDDTDNLNEKVAVCEQLLRDAYEEAYERLGQFGKAITAAPPQDRSHLDDERAPVEAARNKPPRRRIQGDEEDLEEYYERDNMALPDGHENEVHGR